MNYQVILVDNTHYEVKPTKKPINHTNCIFNTREEAMNCAYNLKTSCDLFLSIFT